MLRPLLIGLVLVNGALLAARLGGAEHWLTGEGREHEPERLQRQVNPGALQVRPIGPTGAAAPALAAPAAAAAPASGAGPEPTAAEATPAGPAPRPASAPASGTAAQAPAGAWLAQSPSGAAGTRSLLCMEAGPFDGAMLAGAKRALRDAGVPDSAWHAASAPPAPRHVLLMGRYPDAEQLQRKAGELRRRHVRYAEVHQSPDIPARLLPSLVLGRYAELPAAEAALAALRQRGVVSAHVVSLDARPAGTLLRMAGPGTPAPTLPGGAAWRPCPRPAEASTAAVGLGVMPDADANT